MLTKGLTIILPPRLELNIINQVDDESTIKYLLGTIREIREYNNLLLFLIPIELRPYFLYGKYRILLSEIDTPQSNTIFYNSSNICDAIIYINKNLTDYKFCTNIFITLLMKAHFPIFLDTYETEILKDQCSIDEHNDKCCYGSFNHVSPSYSKERIDSIISEIIGINYQERIFRSIEINKDSIHSVFALICQFHNIRIDDYPQLLKLDYNDNFFIDLKSVDTDDLKDILFSTLRAVIFPSSRDSQRRTNFSIDIHPNEPFKINGYNLYRIDVVKPNMSGMCRSGKLRVLMGIKNEKRYIIAFTKEHDFSLQLIKNRTGDK